MVYRREETQTGLQISLFDLVHVVLTIPIGLNLPWVVTLYGLGWSKGERRPKVASELDPVVPLLR